MVPWFAGRPVHTVPLADRGPLVAPLADAVVALHVPAPAEAPHSPVRGVPLAARDPAVRARLGAAGVPAADRLLAVWADATAVPAWDGPAVWLHGDLHPGNMLRAPDGGLAALLDFGDLTAGDPATDLATAWPTFGPRDRRAFRDRVTAATGTDDATWARARGWAVCLATAMLAHSDDDPGLAALGRTAAEQVLAG